MSFLYYLFGYEDSFLKVTSRNYGLVTTDFDDWQGSQSAAAFDQSVVARFHYDHFLAQPCHHHSKAAAAVAAVVVAAGVAIVIVVNVADVLQVVDQ